jgi:hypothetical protein
MSSAIVSRARDIGQVEKGGEGEGEGERREDEGERKEGEGEREELTKDEFDANDPWEPDSIYDQLPENDQEPLEELHFYRGECIAKDRIIDTLEKKISAIMKDNTDLRRIIASTLLDESDCVHYNQVESQVPNYLKSMFE